MTARSLFIGTTVGLFLLFTFSYLATAFTGPTQNPPNGNGVISYVNNYVGIGTSNPRSVLSLGNTVTSTKFLIYDNADNNKYGFGIQSFELRQFYPSDARLAIGTISTANGSFTERVRVDSSGNVGIGNNNPQYKLDVTGNINFTGSLYQNGVLFSAGSNQWTTGAAVLYPSSTATNVAIGANSVIAGYKLNVVGRSTFDTCGNAWGGVVTIGCNNTDYTANSGWGGVGFASNLVLNGLNSTAITFHDGGDSISNIRYAGMNFRIGENVGWGTSTVNIAGPLVLGRYPSSSAPAGVSGMMFYDTTNNIFKCFTTSTWSNCGGGAVYQ